MRNWLVVAALAVGNVAYAQDPLEQAASKQVAAQAQGAAQVGPFYKGEGEKTDYSIVLEANKCYWFSGVTQGKIDKLALYLWTPNAKFFTPRVADAKSTTGAAVMAYCTKEAGMYKMQAKIEGKGVHLVGVYAKEAPKQPDPPPAAAVKEAATPDLGPLCDKRAAGAAPGAKRIGDYFEGKGNSIGSDDRFDYPVQMDGGKCYWLIACGEPDKIKSIALSLWGPDNKRITDTRGDSPNPMIGHCATATGMFKFQAKITGGGGHFKAAVYSK
jgi:hypothetical protein